MAVMRPPVVAAFCHEFDLETKSDPSRVKNGPSDCLVFVANVRAVSPKARSLRVGQS